MSNDAATDASDSAGSAPPTKIQVEKSIGLPSIALCATDTAGPSSILMGMSDFLVHRLDMFAEQAKPIAIAPQGHASYVTGLVRHDDLLVSGGYDGALVWWQAESGEIVHRREQAHDKWIRGLALSPDGTRLVSVADDMQTKLWDLASGELLDQWGDHASRTPHGYPSMLYAVAYSACGTWIATGDRTGQVYVRQADSGAIIQQLETPVLYTWDPRARRHSIGGIRALSFSHDGQWLAVGGMGKVNNIDHLEGPSRVEVFAWRAEQKLEIEDTKFKGLVERIAFSPDDSWLLCAGGDHSGFVSAYALDGGKLLAQEKTGRHIHDFVWQPEQNRLLTVGHQQASILKL